MLSLEQRLSKAEHAEGEALRELREAESAAVDQESLLLRANALENKVKEYRAEQGQLENYKQVSNSPNIITTTMMIILNHRCASRLLGTYQACPVTDPTMALTLPNSHPRLLHGTQLWTLAVSNHGMTGRSIPHCNKPACFLRASLSRLKHNSLSRLELACL